jgi:hypothetical protein
MTKQEVQSKGMEVVGGSEYHFCLMKKITDKKLSKNLTFLTI